MDELIIFKLKKNKDNKKILFIIINKESLDCVKEMKEEIIKKYITIASKHDKIYVCIDTRKVTYFNPKVIWEGASDLAKHNHILVPRIKATSILICNNFLLDTIGLVNKVIPFSSPTKFFSKNDDALKFLSES